MRWLSLLFLLVVSTLSLTLSTEPPKIVLDKTVAEVGRVKKGEKVRVEFSFRNEGGSVLRILSLTPA